MTTATTNTFQTTFTKVDELLAAARENNEINDSSWLGWGEGFGADPIAHLSETYEVELDEEEAQEALAAYQILAEHEKSLGTEAADYLSKYWADPGSNAGKVARAMAFSA